MIRRRVKTQVANELELQFQFASLLPLGEGMTVTELL